MSKTSATTYVGTGEIGFLGEFEINGQWQEYSSTQWLEEVELTLQEPTGAQEVELTADVVDCETTICKLSDTLTGLVILLPSG